MTEEESDGVGRPGHDERVYDGHKVVLLMLLLFVLVLALSAWIGTVVMSDR